MKDKFGLDEVAQHFCFPSLGFAVGLRPGDVLIFNPHVHHCLSEKSEAFFGDNVHVSTCYLKTKHVSKNDTFAKLTEDEKKILAEEAGMLDINFLKKIR